VIAVVAADLIELVGPDRLEGATNVGKNAQRSPLRNLIEELARISPRLSECGSRRFLKELRDGKKFMVPAVRAEEVLLACGGDDAALRLHGLVHLPTDMHSAREMLNARYENNPGEISFRDKMKLTRELWALARGIISEAHEAWQTTEGGKLAAAASEKASKRIKARRAAVAT
jgi:hypothetical protein